MDGLSVFVACEGSNLFHVDPDCSALIKHRQFGIGRCSGKEAHFSTLSACTACTGDVAEQLRRRHGVMASGERHKRGRPRLFTVVPASTTVNEEDDEASVPYGAPDDVDDLRFSNPSLADWGTASFRQNVDEFLSEDTDDDNDWRGGGRRLLD